MAGFMGAVKFESGCTAEQLTIADVELPIRRPGEIMIRVHSSAINRADTLQVNSSQTVRSNSDCIEFIFAVPHSTDRPTDLMHKEGTKLHLFQPTSLPL